MVAPVSLLLLLSHFSRVQLCATPQTAAHQAPLSLGFSRQEHWSGLPFPSPMLAITNSWTQTHVHWPNDAIQPSYPLWSSSPLALHLSQLQGLFKWVTSSHQVAKILVSASTSILPMNTQDWFPLEWTGWIPLQSKGLSRVFSNTTVEKDQFFSTQPSLWISSHICTWLMEKP